MRPLGGYRFRMSTLTPQEARELWATTLETTDRPQAKCRLAIGEARCCLGIACDLAVEQGVITSYRPDAPLAPDAVAKWLGLSTRYDPDMGSRHYQNYYSNLNDNVRASFKDIAKKVRELDD